MRERLTGQNHEAAEVEAEIKALERRLSAFDDAAIAGHADSIAKQEKDIVSQRDVGVSLKDYGDQNARANNNWAISESDKMAVASRLVKLAKALLA